MNFNAPCTYGKDFLNDYRERGRRAAILDGIEVEIFIPITSSTVAAIVQSSMVIY